MDKSSRHRSVNMMVLITDSLRNDTICIGTRGRDVLACRGLRCEGWHSEGREAIRDRKPDGLMR